MESTDLLDPMVVLAPTEGADCYWRRSTSNSRRPSRLRSCQLQAARRIRRRKEGLRVSGDGLKPSSLSRDRWTTSEGTGWSCGQSIAVCCE